MCYHTKRVGHCGDADTCPHLTTYPGSLGIVIHLVPTIYFEYYPSTNYGLIVFVTFIPASAVLYYMYIYEFTWNMCPLIQSDCHGAHGYYTLCTLDACIAHAHTYVSVNIDELSFTIMLFIYVVSVIIFVRCFMNKVYVLPFLSTSTLSMASFKVPNLHCISCIRDGGTLYIYIYI